jgi:hypothetical protein
VAFLIAVVLAVLAGGDRGAATAATLPSACEGHSHGESFVASNGAEGCRFHTEGMSATVMLDSAPQAYERMEREQVEFWQNVEWSHKTARAAPRPVGHLGIGAFWFPVQSRLLTTDGVRLVTVKVRAPSSGPSERKSAAARLARTYLGPPQKPAGY